MSNNGPSFLAIIAGFAAVLIVVILFFFGIGYALGRAFL